MKILLFILGLTLSLVAKKNHQDLAWYQSLEYTHHITYKKSKFEDNQVRNVPLSEEDITDEYLVLSSYNYLNKFSYKSIFLSLLLNYTQGEDQFFDNNNNRILSRNVLYEQYTIVPEVFFKWKLIAVGIGYFGSIDDGIPHRDTFLYHKNRPFFTLQLDQKIARKPLYFLLNFYTSPKEVTFDDETIYSTSIGFRWDITYYVSINTYYTRNYLSADGIEDNITRIQFSYRILPTFSIGTSYSQLVYTEDRIPYDEISAKVTYFHDFAK